MRILPDSVGPLILRPLSLKFRKVEKKIRSSLVQDIETFL